MLFLDGGAVLQPPHAGELSLNAATLYIVCLLLLTPEYPYVPGDLPRYGGSAEDIDFS